MKLAMERGDPAMHGLRQFLRAVADGVRVAYLPDAAMKWPVGTRTPLEDNTIAAVVQRSGRPATWSRLLVFVASHKSLTR
jgi:hypothetical protein